MKRLITILSILFLSSNNKIDIKYCDIKGYINNPGVYEIKTNYTIQDIIDLAGGLKKNAYTDNINLSKKVTDEMVIYIFNKSEIETAKELNNCRCEPIYKYIECNETTTTQITTTTSFPITTQTTTTSLPVTSTQSSTQQIPTTTNITSTTTTKKIYTDKININICTLEELIELDGLGEIKAKKIIDYRESNGLYENIEDILNIDGIGKTTFEKIKEHIKV